MLWDCFSQQQWANITEVGSKIITLSLQLWYREWDSALMMLSQAITLLDTTTNKATAKPVGLHWLNAWQCKYAQRSHSKLSRVLWVIRSKWWGKVINHLQIQKTWESAISSVNSELIYTDDVKVMKCPKFVQLSQNFKIFENTEHVPYL